MTAATLCFWASAGLLVYAWAGYPALLWIQRRLRPLPLQPDPRAPLPRISVLIACHDEAGTIGRKVADVLLQDYPADRLDLVVIDDGSNDGTAETAREAAGRADRPGATQVIRFPVRRGKAACLRAVAPSANGEILVLADARQRLAPGALEAIAGVFRDPAVGAASGELVLEGAGGTSLYWSYEKTLRRLEGETGSCIGTTGALHAIRRSLFPAIPADTILDDVAIPLEVIRSGHRVVFVPQARVIDTVAPDAREFQRKARTMAGNFQLLARPQAPGSPYHRRVALRFLSHKGLRLLAPLLLAALAVSSAFAGPAYRPALDCQIVAYACAAIGWVLGRTGLGSPAVFSIPYAFCLLHLAVIAGLWGWVTGRQTAVWTRPAPTPSG